MQLDKSRRKGFSLIEALVALAIAALCFVAIFELQDQMTKGQVRLQRALATAELERNALELVLDVNMMEHPQGERVLAGEQIVRWSADRLTEPRRNAGFPVGDGSYDVALYNVEVIIEAQGGRPLARLEFERLGWRSNIGTEALSSLAD